MNKKGFVGIFGFLFNPVILLILFLLSSYIFLRYYGVTQWNITIVIVAIVVGILANIYIIDGLFFINFALLGLVGSYEGIARYYLSIPQIPNIILLFFSAYFIGSVISRLSLHITGVGA